MRKSLVALALILLFLGIIIMSFFNVTKQSYVPESPPLDTGTGNYPNVSANFTIGEILNLYMSPGATWSQGQLEPESEEIPYPTRFVWINITNPDGNLTILEFAFGASDSSFALYQISLLNSTDFTTVRTTSPGTLGYSSNVTMSGNYTIALWQLIPALSSQSPPGAFQLTKLNVQYVKAYPDYVLPVGAVVFISGVAVLVLAWWEPWKKWEKKEERKKPVFS